MTTQHEIAAALLRDHGTTFAAEAGITLKDTPAPLWQLLILTELLAKRIRSDAAVDTARAMFEEGWRTPEHLDATTWDERVKLLGEHGYRRLDESTATRLPKLDEQLRDRWRGDLRRLRDDADGDPERISELLQEFDGIGPAGAAIFLREVQAVWPSVRPFADELVLDGAKAAGLPADAERLADLVDGDEFARLAAALVRVAKEPALLDEPDADSDAGD